MREAIEITLSIVLGLVFLASAIPKLRRPKSFILVVLEYRILPPALGQLYARVLPPVEFLVGLLLITGVAVRVAAICSSAILLSFIVAVGISIAQNRDLDCGCFGQGRERRIGWGLMLSDGGLLAASVALSALFGGPPDSTPWSALRLAGVYPTTGWTAILLCTATAASCAVGLARTRPHRGLATGVAESIVTARSRAYTSRVD